MIDTTPEIEERQFAMMSKLGPGRRIELACEMYMAARESILRAMPADISETERKRILITKMYGEDFDGLFSDSEDK